MTSSLKFFFNSLLYKANRFQVAARLFSSRSQRTSKCGKNISDTLGCATFLFLPHFDVICDLLLNRRTATWNLFVKQATLLASKCHAMHFIINATRTKWSPIPPVIIWVINKIRRPRSGLRFVNHEVLLPINRYHYNFLKSDWCISCFIFH